MLTALAAPARALAALTDVDILNFGLRFDASRRPSTPRLTARNRFTICSGQAALGGGARRAEHAHVRIIKKFLGDKAGKRPSFDSHGVTESDNSFTRTAVAMEDLTVAFCRGSRRVCTIAG